MKEHHLLLIWVFEPVPKHTQTIRSTFPEGLFIREGADGCCLMRRLTGVCTGVVLGPCCGVVVRILDLRFAQGCYCWRSFYPMREELQGQADTWLLLECAVSCNYRLDQHLSCPSKWWFGQPWYYLPASLSYYWRNWEYLEFCLFYESKLFCTGSQLIEMTNMQT